MFEAIRQVGQEIKSCGGIKAKIAVLLYRLATLYRSRNPLWKICGPWRARIGYGLKLYHPHCIVINRGTIIGQNCTLRQGVTIGSVTDSQGRESASPRIGDNVEFGAHAVVIGAVTLGDNVKVGAGTVVTKDLAAGMIAVGQPYRVLNGD